MSVKIINGIAEEFEKAGNMPSRDLFLYCHFPKGIFSSVKKIEMYNGFYDDKVPSFNQMKELDKFAATSILKLLQISNFEPYSAFGTLLYNTLDNLGALSLTNTVIKYLPGSENITISIFKQQDKKLVVYYKNNKYSFKENIVFGDRKYLVTFDKWFNNRHLEIDNIYTFLSKLLEAKKDETHFVYSLENPEVNQELLYIYLSQLKAIRDAV